MGPELRLKRIQNIVPRLPRDESIMQKSYQDVQSLDFVLFSDLNIALRVIIGISAKRRNNLPIIIDRLSREFRFIVKFLFNPCLIVEHLGQTLHNFLFHSPIPDLFLPADDDPKD
jgi:hypothetical protein